MTFSPSNAQTALSPHGYIKTVQFVELRLDQTLELEYSFGFRAEFVSPITVRNDDHASGPCEYCLDVVPGDKATVQAVAPMQTVGGGINRRGPAQNCRHNHNQAAN